MVIHLHKENGHVADGRTLDQCLAFLPNGDYVAEIVTKADWEKRQPRTLSQNALFWIWCADIANFFNSFNRIAQSLAALEAFCERKEAAV